MYALDTLRNPVRTAYASAIAIYARVSHNIRLHKMRAFPAEKQLCWFQYYSAGKEYHDFILSLMAFPYSNISYC